MMRRPRGAVAKEEDTVVWREVIGWVLGIFYVRGIGEEDVQCDWNSDFFYFQRRMNNKDLDFKGVFGGLFHSIFFTDLKFDFF